MNCGAGLSTKTVLIIGGYGVFGGKLAQALARDGRFDVVVAGRNLAKAEAFCEEFGGRALVFDTRSTSLSADIAAQTPFIVVDAAGPFQGYGERSYRVAEAAIDCGAHYLDLSDDAGFTAGISTLDAAASKAGVVVLSGVSSVPAMSSAAVEDLTDGMVDIHLIESVILPGNRAPRGMSVMRAILAQVGRRMRVWRGGAYETPLGWSGGRGEVLEIDGIAPMARRRSSLIGAPDLALFPEFFNARSVEFRAGLDLWVMHWGLAAVGWLVRLRLMRSAAPLAGVLKWVADRLEPFGSDRGGMRVRVVGRLTDGRAVQRDWVLIAEAGDGPHIPAAAARVMCKRLLAGKVKAGARACLAEFSLGEVESEMADLQVAFGQTETLMVPLFRQVLGKQFNTLPPEIQALHEVLHIRRWQGQARITRGAGILSRLICRIVGFPPAGNNVPVRVTMHRKGAAEHWLRDFGGKRFRSVMTRAGDGAVWERFGPFRFEIPFTVLDGQLGYPVRRARLFGVPWPKVLTPKSDAFEGVDADERATFDVMVSLPIVGMLVRYQGWLGDIEEGGG